MIGRVLSDTQARAATAEGHAVVVAAAGSGKTRMLVERVLELIFEDQIPLREIVAITFTNRAAAEMRQRLRERLREIAAGKAPDDAKERARECLNTFHLAHVKTIHAFAMEILQTHPFDADIDPDFAIADELLRHQARYDTVDSMLQEIPPDSPRERSPVLNLLLQWGHFRTVEALQALLARDQIDFQRVEEIANSTEEREFQRAQRNWERHARDLVESAAKSFDVMDQLQALASMIATAAITTPLANLPVLTRTLADSDQTLSMRAQALTDLFPLFLTAKGEPRAKPVSKEHGKKADLGEDLWKSLIASFPIIGSALEPITEDWIEWNEQHERRAATISVALMRLLRDAIKSLRERKDTESWLDFGDQLRMATELVEKHPERVAATLVRRFRAILIDEFQDTDPLQWRLVEALLSAKTDEALRVMLVGDPRQSIYRFRGAEVNLFTEAAKRLEEQPAGSPTESVSLDENYRTTPPLISAINGIVNDLIERLTADTSAPMQPAPMIPRVDEKIWPRGLHLIPVPKQESNDRALRIEADSIAASINALVHHPERWRDRVWAAENAEEFNPRFGDIAILLRQMTHLDAFEHALRLANIPFHVGGGAGLASRQEIMDLAHLMRVITAPTDDQALVGLLRTPWMGWSDDLLMKVTILTCGFASKSAPPLWDRLRTVERTEKDGIALSDAEWMCVEKTRRILNSAMDESHHRSPADVAERVLTDTGAWALIRMESEGPRRLANVRRGLERLRETTSSEGFDSVHAAAQMLGRLLSQRARLDEERTVGASENAVRILTVHGAKGLEYPVVFLPQLHTTNPGREKAPNWAWDKALGLGVKAQHPDRAWEFKPNAAMQMITQREEREIEAERARLLYVAMTRAQRMLVVSGNVNESLDTATQAAKRGSVLEWIFDAIQIAPGDLAKPEITPQWSDGHPIPVLTPERCSAVAGDMPQPKPDRIDALPITADLLNRTSPLPEVLDPERSISITALSTIAHENANAEPWKREHSGDIPRIGDLFHAIAEHRPGNPNLDPGEILAEITDKSDRHLHDEVIDLWHRFEAMPLGQEFDQLEEALPELNITVATDAGALDGRIDLLAKRNGQWEVIDYKTTASDGSEETLRERNRHQMLCYLLFLADHAPDQSELTARVVFPALEREVTMTVDRSEMEIARREITQLVQRFKLNAEQ